MKLKSVLLVIVFIVQSICVFAEVDPSMLEVTSTRFMKEFSYDETQSYNDEKTKVYKPSRFKKLVEIDANIYFWQAEWNLKKLTLQTKKNRTVDLLAVSYCTNVGGGSDYSSYYLAQNGTAFAVLGKEGAQNIYPYNNAPFIRPYMIFASGWKKGRTHPLKLIFEINADDLPVSLIWDGYRESPCKINK